MDTFVVLKEVFGNTLAFVEFVELFIFITFGAFVGAKSGALFTGNMARRIEYLELVKGEGFIKRFSV